MTSSLPFRSCFKDQMSASNKFTLSSLLTISRSYSLCFVLWPLIMSAQECFSRLSCPMRTSNSQIRSCSFLISCSFVEISPQLESCRLICLSYFLHAQVNLVIRSLLSELSAHVLVVVGLLTSLLNFLLCLLYELGHRRELLLVLQGHLSYFCLAVVSQQRPKVKLYLVLTQQPQSHDYLPWSWRG